jgi:hypothetical protein
MAKELSKMKWHNSNQSPTQREEGGSHLQQSAGEKKKIFTRKPKEEAESCLHRFEEADRFIIFLLFFFFRTQLD